MSRQNYLMMALDLPGATPADFGGHQRVHIPHPLGSFTYAEGGMVGCDRALTFAGAHLSDSNLGQYKILLAQFEKLCELFDLPEAALGERREEG